MENTPISVLLAQAKADINNSIQQAVTENGLPASLIELILSDILSEVRRQSALEVFADMNKGDDDNA